VSARVFLEGGWQISGERGGGSIVLHSMVLSIDVQAVTFQTTFVVRGRRRRVVLVHAAGQPLYIVRPMLCHAAPSSHERRYGT